MQKQMRIMPGDIIKHFKRELVNTVEDPYAYLYVLLDYGKNTETEEEFAVYKALYGEYITYIRPVSMFLSEVERTVYPNIKQKYRFEVVTSNEDLIEKVNAQYSLMTTHQNMGTAYRIVVRDIVSELEK